MKYLKLVGHKRFSSPHIQEDVVLKGGIICCEDNVADGLLKATVADVANNKHSVWQEVTKEEAEGTGAEEAQTPAQPSRRKSASKKTATVA